MIRIDMATAQLLSDHYISRLVHKLSTKSMITEYASLAFGIMVFFLLLIFPPPPFMNEIVVNSNSMIMILFLLVFFTLLLNKNGNGWETTQAGFVFALFAMTLVYKWQFAPNSGEIIGGLLPWSDAASYNLEAHRLANGGLLSTWGGRRPLFSGFLAVLLRLTGDFMITLSIMTLLNALAVFFVFRMVKRLYGSTGAAIYLVVSLDFYARFSGTTLSEQLGFAAGNLALFFLLLGTHTGSLSKALFGLAVLTLALNARAGAFFILPILSLWLGFSFRQRTALWRSLSLSISVVILVFLLNLIIVRVIADPRSTTFSNYSYTLYGLASGNKGWTQITKDYPGVAESQVMPLAIQKIRSEPIMLFKGILGSFGDYFKPTYGAFNFIYRGLFEQQIHLMLWGLVGLGLAHSISKWKEGFHSLTLVSFLGVISSVPLLPPLDSDGMRVYAATIPFSILWIATGVSVLFTWGRKIVTETPNENDVGTKIALHFQKPASLFSIVLVFFMVPAPLLLKAFVPAPHSLVSFSTSVCEPGEHVLNGMKFRNTSIFIVGDGVAAESYMPFVRVSDFHSAISITSASPFLNDELLKLKAGDQLSFGLRMEHSAPSDGLWMISTFPVKDEFSVCSLGTDNKELKHYNFYYLKGGAEPASALTTSQKYIIATRIIRLILGMATGFVLFLLIRGVISLRHQWLIHFLYIIGVTFLALPVGGN
jgi:hypothetical protein